MRAPARLGLYGAGLVAVFAVAFTTAGAVVPDQTVQSWTAAAAHDAAGHDAGATQPSLGLASSEDGYRLTGLVAPDAVGDDGRLSLTVTGPDGSPVTDVEVEHEEELHLVVVRADGQHFRHVHPERDAEGTWSIPWRWEAAGSYRVIADTVPAETGEGLTLSTSVQVGGDYAPAPAEGPVRETGVDGFDIVVTGDLQPGAASRLTMTLTRDGEPVTALEPYLGAFGHLVALRDGDLAYLHVHPHGDTPEAGETSGPEVVFEATAPTPGRYLLYLDFRVDGQVHTAPLVVDTTGTAAQGTEGDGHDH